MEIINGKQLAIDIKNKVKLEIDRVYLSRGKKAPTLACIIVEGNKASEVYVANKEKSCLDCLMNSIIVRLPGDVSQDKLDSTIMELNKDDNISGILLQLPLPDHLDEDRAINKIDSSKDVDCLTYTNLGRLLSARPIIAPCTATGIMRILEKINYDLSGKNVVVVGRSLLVGKSVANLLEQKNATVTICHSRTNDLAKVTSKADVLVVAIGKPEFITEEYVKNGAVVIDVGINRLASGLKGDVAFERVKEMCSYITPVPGGVGPLTVACLMENTLILDKIRRNIQ